MTKWYFFPEMQGRKLNSVMYCNKLEDEKNDHFNKHRKEQENLTFIY